MDKRLIALVGVVLVVLVVAGAGKRQKVEDVGVSFSESDLDSLGAALDDLSFDDLGGLNGTSEVSEFDLDALGEALDQLSFDDLEGITEN